MRFKAESKESGSGSDEGVEDPDEEGEEPLSEKEIAERRTAMQEAVRERQHEAVEEAHDAAREFEECVDDCRAEKDAALADAHEKGTTPPEDPNRECCVSWHNYLCFCFAGGCCGSED